MNRPFATAMYVLLFIFAILVGSVVIGDGAEIIADIAQHIRHLFHRASLNPNISRGFGAFVQLIILAVFFGWAINRFRRKK
jgi:hypothetical protein